MSPTCHNFQTNNSVLKCISSFTEPASLSISQEEHQQLLVAQSLTFTRSTTAVRRCRKWMYIQIDTRRELQHAPSFVTNALSVPLQYHEQARPDKRGIKSARSQNSRHLLPMIVFPETDLRRIGRLYVAASSGRQVRCAQHPPRDPATLVYEPKQGEARPRSPRNMWRHAL